MLWGSSWMSRPMRMWLMEKPYSMSGGREIRITLERAPDEPPDAEPFDALCLFEDGKVVVGFSGTDDSNESFANKWCEEHLSDETKALIRSRVAR